MFYREIGRPIVATSLDRRSFGSLLASAAGVACLAPWPAGAATDDPPPAARTYAVSSSRTFASRLASAQPGDHIVLAPGTWSGNWTLSQSGSSKFAPIVIKAATKNGVTMTGTLTLAGQFTTVYGLRFSGNSLGVQIARDDTSVLRCWFMGPRGVKASNQQNVRIGYNRFTGGPVRDLGGGHHVYFDIPIGNDVQLPEGGRIYRNAFASLSGSGSDGEYMHIYIGDTGGRDNTPSLTDFEVSYNRIYDSIRRRGIYTKRGGFVMFNHVLGRGPGVTGIRHGGGGRFSGNRIDNINSVIINGPDHEVKGNWVRAQQGLRLECEYVSSSGTFYNAAHRALLVGNNATVTVGNIQDGATLVTPVNGVRIYNHTGSVVLAQQEGTEWVTTPRSDMTYPATVTLGLNDVGPDAP
ncbi:MAG: chondroitinase-B domain-containing protein [Geminicoccaceae bacterium]